MRIAVDIDSTLHDHWPLVAAAAKRRFGVDLPYDEQVPSTPVRLTEAQLRRCVEDTHTDAAIAAARPYPHAVETVNAWCDAGQEIHVTSHRSARSVAATQRWLDAIGLRRQALYAGADKVAYCVREGIGLLIDDTPATLLRALDGGIRVATLRHPWNAHVCEDPRITCAEDWLGLAHLPGPPPAARAAGGRVTPG